MRAVRVAKIEVMKQNDRFSFYYDIRDRLIKQHGREPSHTEIQTEINTLDEDYKNSVITSELPPYYHGSDARIFRMTDDERHFYKQLCKNILNLLFPIFKQYQDYNWLSFSAFEKKINHDSKEDKSLLREFASCYVVVRGWLNGAPLYQYDDNVLYITNNKAKAQQYAIQAAHFGEIGDCAYKFIKSIKFLQIPEDEKIELIHDINIQQFLEFAEGTAEPVVFEVSGIDAKYLKSESGGPLYLMLKSGLQDLRYYGDISNLSFKEILNS